MEDIKTSKEQLLRREALEAVDEVIDLFKYGYIVTAKVPKNNDEEAQYIREASNAFNKAGELGRALTSTLKKIAREGIEGVL